MNAAAGLESTLLWALAALVAAAVVLPYVVGFHRRRDADRARLLEARALGIDRPVAQFPFVDPISCIGCGACVRACPEGDVLGVVGGVAVVINGLRCVGHGRCADACPVGAIEIGLGDLKGRPDVPILSAEQESTLPGVFVAGELSGLALIRNAIQQGTTVARTVARRLRAGDAAGDPTAFDLLVVGAGPAGVAAALAAREEGLRAVVIDQAASLGGTILHFPRRKMVLTQPVSLPGGDALAREEYSKEELLALLGERIAARRLDVRFGERLEGITGREGAYDVATSAAVHRARYVVLALGRRGTPRKLGVPGEERAKVMYQLRDSETYKRQRILVVGGGDSAIEAAVGLARQAGNDVTLSYRKSAFHRIKQKNQAAIESMSRSRKLRVVFESEVVEIEEDRVQIRVGNETRILDNDYVFVFIGGDPPYRFLEQLGVRFGGAPKSRSAPRAGAAAVLALAAALAALPVAGQESPHGEMEIRCESCHTTADWKVVRKDVTFDHDGTGFPLAGVHAQLDCSQCHNDKVFRRVGTACADCHRDDHRGELGLDCASCHAPSRWDVRTDFYAAHAKTLFPLVAAHARVDCDACHTAAPPRQFTNVPTDCVACHRADFVAAATPAHGATPTDCRLCHQAASESWTRVDFRHSDRFPLSGGHAALLCADCHRGQANTVSPDCYACHRDDFEATRDPNHVRAGFSTQCVACHSSVGWNTAVFDHFTAGFPLDGAHRTTPCGNCHLTGYAGTPRDCVACHRADYDTTRDPAHAAAGFPTTCQNCHTTIAWEGAAFDHASVFALTGAHAAVDCASCHRSGYAGTPRDCVGCHRADYDATTDPAHAAAGFPTSCQTCHTTTAWEGAAFDHSTSRFPLTGAHRSVACASCHTSGYAGTPRDCVACHRDDYDATRDPNHAAAGFPTSCQSCHSTNSWDGATFDHDAAFFPIYSGNHQGKWASCSTCHVVSGNYSVFECTGCHTRADTDPDHSGVSGYSFNSNACLSCHPDGEE